MPTKKRSASLMRASQAEKAKTSSAKSMMSGDANKMSKPMTSSRPKTGEIKFTGKDVTVGAQRMTPNQMAQKLAKKTKKIK